MSPKLMLLLSYDMGNEQICKTISIARHSVVSRKTPGIANISTTIQYEKRLYRLNVRPFVGAAVLKMQ